MKTINLKDSEVEFLKMILKVYEPFNRLEEKERDTILFILRSIQR